MPIGDYPPNNSTDKPKEEPGSIDRMTVFRAYISKKIEERRKAQADKVQTDLGMIELLKVDVDELTEADAIMWENAEKYIKGLIKKEELDLEGEYKKDVLDSGLSSRINLYAVIANMISPTWIAEEMKEIENIK